MQDSRGPGTAERCTIDGYRCRLERIAVDEPEAPRSRAVEIYVLDDPSAHVDAEALLRDAETPDPPFWTLVWIGARAVARRMLDRPPPPGARVLDLGCGLGLAGIAAGLGGASVTFCDRAPECLPVVRASADANRLRDARTSVLDFRTMPPPGRFDLVLAADLAYEPEAYERLAAFLAAATAPDGTLLVTESLRADTRRFLERLAGHGFVGEREAMWLDEDGRRERTWLHAFSRRSAAGWS